MNTAPWESSAEPIHHPPSPDNDGIPDAIELQMGTDPHRPDSLGDVNRDGYLNIEEYLNSLAN